MLIPAAGAGCMSRTHQQACAGRKLLAHRVAEVRIPGHFIIGQRAKVTDARFDPNGLASGKQVTIVEHVCAVMMSFTWPISRRLCSSAACCSSVATRINFSIASRIGVEMKD